jgi:hypothetical protein
MTTIRSLDEANLSSVGVAPYLPCSLHRDQLSMTHMPSSFHPVNRNVSFLVNSGSGTNTYQFFVLDVVFIAAIGLSLG